MFSCPIHLELLLEYVFIKCSPVRVTFCKPVKDLGENKSKLCYMRSTYRFINGDLNKSFPRQC